MTWVWCACRGRWRGSWPRWRSGGGGRRWWGWCSRCGTWWPGQARGGSRVLVVPCCLITTNVWCTQLTAHTRQSRSEAHSLDFPLCFGQFSRIHLSNDCILCYKTSGKQEKEEPSSLWICVVLLCTGFLWCSINSTFVVWLWLCVRFCSVVPVTEARACLLVTIRFAGQWMNCARIFYLNYSQH